MPSGQLGTLWMIMKWMMMPAAAAICGMITSAGYAESDGRPPQGGIITQNVCAECHAVQREDLRSPNADAPPFAKLATTPGMTTIALTAALRTSHRTMPNIVLQAGEAADVIAYILSLKNGD